MTTNNPKSWNHIVPLQYKYATNLHYIYYIYIWSQKLSMKNCCEHRYPRRHLRVMNERWINPFHFIILMKVYYFNTFHHYELEHLHDDPLVWRTHKCTNLTCDEGIALEAKNVAEVLGLWASGTFFHLSYKICCPFWACAGRVNGEHPKWVHMGTHFLSPFKHLCCEVLSDEINNNRISWLSKQTGSRQS